MTNDKLKLLAEDFAQKIQENHTFTQDEKSQYHSLFIYRASSMHLDKPIEDTTKTDSDVVGIWESYTVDGKKAFRRTVSEEQDSIFWSDIEYIPPKSDKVRIAFLGESVARGYLLCPEFTPAKTLQSILDKNSSRVFEVLDLTRSSMGVEELTELCQSVQKLEPEYVVVFAGNNWRNSLWPLSEEESKRIDLLEKQSPDFNRDLEKFFKEKMEGIVKRFFDSISDIAQNLNFIFIIPEVNIADWVPSENECIPLWLKERDAEWFQLQDEMEQECLEGYGEKLKRLVELNPFGALGYYNLGIFLEKQNRTDESQEQLIAARTAGLYSSLFSVPCCYDFQADRILDYCGEKRIHVVDLRKVFRNHLDGKLPGNALFLDYCHLNINGIKLAMKSLASTILRNRFDQEIELPSEKPEKEKRLMGMGHFLSAVHCAHVCRQKKELLLYHCREAVKNWPEVTNLMHSYLRLTSRKLPWIYNKECQVLIKSTILKSYPLLYQPKNCMIIDITLTESMLTAMHESGFNYKNEIINNICTSFSIHDTKLDLLQSYYRENSYQISNSSTGYYFSDQRAFISSIEQKSRFYLVMDHVAQEITLLMTLKLPFPLEENEEASIMINGVKCSTFFVNGNWKNYELPIDNTILHRGVNHIVIEWPYLDKNYNRYCEYMRSNQTGYQLYLRNSRPLYGDIARMVVCKANV